MPCFQEGVEFHNLGLTIIDEQHRFGVHQRLALRKKGASLDGETASNGPTPHQLIMTATPIPRTLAMSAYADLDCSVIDELPPGRTPVETVALSNLRRSDVIERVRASCSNGRQAYWVCTLIEESDVLEAQAAEATAQELQLLLSASPSAWFTGGSSPVRRCRLCRLSRTVKSTCGGHHGHRGGCGCTQCQPDD